MPSYRKNKKATRKWLARRNRERIEYFLGYHETRKEAEVAEKEFDELWPAGLSLDDLEAQLEMGDLLKFIPNEGDTITIDKFNITMVGRYEISPEGNLISK